MRTPWALWALATAILPWFFVLRRRLNEVPRKISFPPLFLLIESPQKRRRSQKRRRFLLATIRSTVFVLLALVWAEPFASNAKKTALVATQLMEDRVVGESATSSRVADGLVDGRPIRVLIVDGSDSGEPRFGESANSNPESTSQFDLFFSHSARRPDAAFYWAAALNPTFAEKDAAQIAISQKFPQVSVVSSVDFSLLSASELDAFDVLFWSDASAPTPEELEKTRRFLNDGTRSLIVAAGSRIRIDRWNKIWRRENVAAKTFAIELNPATGEPLEPFGSELSAKLQRAETQGGDESPLEAAFLGPLAKTPNSGIESLPIWRVFPTLGNDVVPILRDQKTGIAVVAKIAVPNVAGSIFWVATAPDERVSALAFAPNFVPLAERIVEFALVDAFGATPTNGAKSETFERERFGASSLKGESVALWRPLAVFVAIELLLSLPNSRRRRLRYRPLTSSRLPRRAP